MQNLRSIYNVVKVKMTFSFLWRWCDSWVVLSRRLHMDKTLIISKSFQLSCSCFREPLKKGCSSHELLMLFAWGPSIPDFKVTKSVIWFVDGVAVYFHRSSRSGWLCHKHWLWFNDYRFRFWDFSCWLDPNRFSGSSPIINWNGRWMKSSVSWGINLKCCVKRWSSFPSKLFAVVEYCCLWIHFSIWLFILCDIIIIIIIVSFLTIY